MGRQNITELNRKKERKRERMKERKRERERERERERKKERKKLANEEEIMLAYSTRQRLKTFILIITCRAFGSLFRHPRSSLLTHRECRIGLEKRQDRRT